MSKYLETRATAMIAQQKIKPLVLRGRMFSPKDLRLIRRCVSQHYEKGRTFISQVICNELDWKQPNGWLKDRACRDVLLSLETLHLVKLPPPHSPPRTLPKSKPRTKVVLAKYDFTSSLVEYPDEVVLVFAKGNQYERVWNAVVDEYHYLGHKVIVGRCIKYLVKTGDILLGAVAFSSSSWRLAPRDTLLTSMGFSAVTIRDCVVNNSRFLILPNVQIPNLASTVLSLATSQIVADWSQYYSITPLVAETFVQPSLYLGTCYKAANWLEIGITKGYAKKGASYHNSQEPKRIFLYGLNRQIRRQLRIAVESQ